MASVYVQKYQRKPNAITKDEFFVIEDKYQVVCQYKHKIERMYKIRIHFEKTPVEGGRWMILEGEPVDRRNGKNYIKAICQPEEIKQVKFPASTFAEFSNAYALESIEKSTNAVIKPLKSVATFEISGTELGVTLALSQMEEIAGSLHVDANEEENDSTNDENIFQISPVTNNASKRLVTQLERALSEHSDGICNVDDYKDAPPSVKRVLVNCLTDNDLEDIDEDMLFDDGMNKEMGSDRPSYIRVYSDSDEQTDDFDVDGSTDHGFAKSPNVGVLSEQLNETAITVPNPKIAKQQEYLKTFAQQIGYSPDKIERALQFVDETTRPSDFLDLLNGLKDTDKEETQIMERKKSESDDDNNTDDDEVIILETETYDMETGEGETIKHYTTEQKSKGNDIQSSVNSSSKSLPDEYRDQLVRDILQESDTNLSVAELKSKNAARQKLLKENFMKQSQQAAKQSAVTQPNSKKKGKNKKKKQNQHRQVSTQQSEKTELHDKQFRLDSADQRTYSKDEDQTCVLRVWNNSVKESDIQTPCYPDQTPVDMPQTPKRKQQSDNSQSQMNDGNFATPNPSFSSQANPNWSQPLKQKQENLHQSPSKMGQRHHHHQHQSPRRTNYADQYNQGKPTQVVTPNFSCPSQPGMPHLVPQSSEELRYIVIDGSNVAMTHGNGKCFSCKGLRICVDYFKQRGHTKITIFVPQWRQRQPSDDNQILDQNILTELKDEEMLVFTPSRRIGRKLVASYDDRFVMELAEAEDGIIVSNDQYRDLMQEKWNWRKLVEERLLMYSFVKDRFMVPNDPLGRDGPCLNDFLRKNDAASASQGVQGFLKHSQGFQSQSVGKQGYYQGNYQGNQGYVQNNPGYYQGNQGKGQSQFHPRENDFPRLNNTEQQNGYFRQAPPPQNFKQVAQAPFYTNQGMLDESDGQVKSTVKGWKQRNRSGGQCRQGTSGTGLSNRTEEETERLFSELKTIFPELEQEGKIRNILANHEKEMDLTKLTNYCMNVFFLK